jgi:hypothetical protein
MTIESIDPDISVTLDGIPISDSLMTISHFDAVQYSISFFKDLLVPGGELALIIDDVQIGAPINIQELSDIAAITEFIDIETSILGSISQGCYGNGNDLIIFEFVPKDTDGNIYMIDDYLNPVLTGAEQYTEIQRFTHSFSFAASCNDFPEGATGEIRILIEDIDIGWSHTFDIYPGRYPEVDLARTEIFIEPDEFSVHTPVLVRVIPYEPSGILAGSGVDVGIITDPPITVISTNYCSTSLNEGSFGEYCLYVSGPPRGGDILVEATLNGEPTGAFSEIHFMPESTLDDITTSDMGQDLDMGFTDLSDIEDEPEFSDLAFPQDLNDQSIDINLEDFPDTPSFDVPEIPQTDLTHQDLTMDQVTADGIDAVEEDSQSLDTDDPSPDDFLEQPLPPTDTDGCACAVERRPSNRHQPTYMLLLITGLIYLRSRRLQPT